MHITSVLNRRTFLAGSMACLGATRIRAAAPNEGPPRELAVCLFSKPLGARKPSELPPLLQEIGVSALDLTCRPGGHVLPERVADDLPAVVALLRAAGVRVPMITTAVVDATKGHAESIVRTASQLGIRYMKLGYYQYGSRDIRGTLAAARDRLRDVVALCRQHGMHAGFHNHSGRYVGSPLWDLSQILQDLPPENIGSYLDPGHATVEGGDGGWRIGMDLLGPRITMLAVKDFSWAKGAKGWRPNWGPLGEGMVNWPEVLRRLKEQGFAGPISLHVEYGPHGAPGSDEEKSTLASINRDMATLQRLLKQAGLI